MPGPGAYKPQFSQVEPKSDKVSHVLHSSDKRQSYFDRLQAEQKGINETEHVSELGCCEKVMRNLSAINQMTNLQSPEEKRVSEAPI